MKPAGRALDIVAVGLGQAGGNLAADFYRRGYRALALNTAHTDLSALGPNDERSSLPQDQRIYIGIDGYDGAGADLTFGRECIAEHRERVREAVLEVSAGADVVLVTAGLGGGTGSAVGELANVLQDLDLPIVVMATLPGEHESGIAKVNAVRAVNQLINAPVLGWIFVDNARIAEIHGNIPMATYFEHINRLILDPLDGFNRLNDRADVRPIRSLDGEDFRRLLLSGGVLNYTERELSDFTVDATMGAVREAMQESSIMPSGFSLENVSYIGVVIEAGEDVLKDVPFSFFEQINEQLKEDTQGSAIYMGVYTTTGSAKPTLHLVSASQALPERIQEIVTEAKREGGQIRDKLQQAVSALDLGEIEDFELFKTHTRTTSRGSQPAARPGPSSPNMQVPSLDRPRPAGRPAPPPRPSQAAGTPSGTPSAKPTAGGNSATSTPAAPPTSGRPGPTPGTAASEPTTAPSNGGTEARPALEADRELYDRLVQEFRDASSDEQRKRVADRLDSDRRSENALVRYYAVRAMTKLDRSMFEQALRQAAEDEDRTVRSIAQKALQ